ncbi:ArsR/SmtB family transcription factor [Nocardiopsis alba]|uniref:ArsR/SmtB family transcription factor n=1 Tax=Nocardiopsis alba TaxID=53437 RepID=UPI0034024418
MSETPEDPNEVDRRPLEVEGEALRGLAHPLRARILDELQMRGPATATLLGERLGESSGSTSYHLRQLFRYGFIENDPERSGGRERWWRIRPGGWRMRGGELLRGPATREATEGILARYYGGRRERLDRWSRLVDERPDDPGVRRWAEAAEDSVAHVRMTPEEAEEFGRDLQDFIRERLRPFQGRTAEDHPGTEPVELQTDLFPNLTGTDADPEDGPSAR